MSHRERRLRIPDERRRRAFEQLRRRARRRIAPAGALALVNAAGDALERGHVGAARDLLEIVVRPPVAEEILSGLLGLDSEPAANPESTGERSAG